MLFFNLTIGGITDKIGWIERINKNWVQDYADNTGSISRINKKLERAIKN